VFGATLQSKKKTGITDQKEEIKNGYKDNFKNQNLGVRRSCNKSKN
jgi:hypothetical protein